VGRDLVGSDSTEVVGSVRVIIFLYCQSFERVRQHN
jgi:hypothetical protein